MPLMVYPKLPSPPNFIILAQTATPGIGMEQEKVGCGDQEADLLRQILQLGLDCLQHHLADCLVVLRPHVLEDDVHPRRLQTHRAQCD